MSSLEAQSRRPAPLRVQRSRYLLRALPLYQDPSVAGDLRKVGEDTCTYICAESAPGINTVHYYVYK